MPIDRGIIDQQLQALGESSRWWHQRELRDLPSVLDAGERILAVARGKIARMRWLRRPWLIVATDRRLICLRSGSRSWRQIEVGADQITRVSLRIGPFRGRLTFSAGGQSYRLLLPRPDAYKLLNALSQHTNAARETMPGFAPSRLVRRVVDHVLALPAAAFDPQAPRAPAHPTTTAASQQQRIESLEEELHQLRQQVDFIEQLLRQRQVAASERESIGSG